MQARREQVARQAYALVVRSPAGRVAFTVLGAALCLAGLGVIAAAFASHPDYPAQTDLWLYMRAADALPGNIYDPALNSGFDRYGYPPMLAEIIAVLKSIVGPQGLIWIWPIACLAALAGSVFILARGFGAKLPLGLVLLLLAIVLFGRVVRSDIVQGQVNAFTLLLLTSGLLLQSRGRVIAASIAFAVMMSLKPFLGIVVIYFALRADWRMMRWALGMGAAVFVASFLPMGLRAFEAFMDWQQATGHFTSPPFVTKPDNQSAYGLAMRLFTETRYATPWINNPSLVALFMTLAVTLATALAIAGLHLGRRQQGPRKPVDPAVTLLECSMMIALVAFCGPLTEGNHMLIVLAGFSGALIVSVARLRQGSPHARLWLAVIAAWALPTFFVVFPRILPFTYGIFPFWHDLSGLEILLTGRSGLLMLLAGGLTAIALWQERRSVAPAITPGRIRFASGWRSEA